MITTLKTTLLAMALSVTASLVAAAPLNLVSAGPSLSASSAELGYAASVAGESVFTGFFDIDGASGTTFENPANVFLDVAYASNAPKGTSFGTLDVSDSSGGLLLGNLVDFGFTDTTVEMLFDLIGGTAAGAFGDQALVTFSLEAGSGIKFLSDLSDGDVLFGTATIGGNLSTIPLPATLPMLLAGVLVLGGRCRARD